MENTHPKINNATPSFGAFSVPSLLLFGILPALIVFALLYYAKYVEIEDEAVATMAQSLATAQGILDDTWNRGASRAGIVAESLRGLKAEHVKSKLLQYQSVWPEVTLVAYDKLEQIIAHAHPLQGGRFAATDFSAPDGDAIDALVKKALLGSPARDYTSFFNRILLSTCAPVSEGDVHAVMVSVALDSLFLQQIKKISNTDVAVVNLDEKVTTKMTGTFLQATPSLESEQWLASFDPLHISHNASYPLLSLGEKKVHTKVAPLLSSGNKTVGVLLVTVPHEGRVPLTGWHILAAVFTGIIIFLLYLLRHRYQATRFIAALGQSLENIVLHEDTHPIKNAWPTPLASALHSMSGSLTLTRAIAQKAIHERDEAERKAEECAAPKEALPLGCKRFFDHAPLGFIQMDQEGRFLQVNQSFAVMLGYDSPLHLQTECPLLQDVCPQQEGAFALEVVRSSQRLQQVLTLKRRDEKARHFTFVRIKDASLDTAETILLEGFFLDRSTQEQNEQLLGQRDAARKQHTSLALLLASTCQHARRYIASLRTNVCGEEAEHTPEEVSSILCRHDASLTLIGDMFADINKISQGEAAFGEKPVTPLDVGFLLERLCNQLAPIMQEKGIELLHSIEKDLALRVSGSQALLRHTLFRALFSVAAAVHGGRMYLSVERDANAPRTQGMSRMLFSVSWTAQEGDATTRDFTREAQRQRGANGNFFAPASNVLTADEKREFLEMMPVHLVEERQILQFLVQGMRGELLEEVVTRELRSVQLIVPFEHLSSKKWQGSSRHAPADAEQAEKQPTDANSEYPLADADEGIPLASLNLPIMDTTLSEEAYDETAKPEGLDILLVDDSLNNRLLFSLFLRDTKHRITEAHNGQEGVEAFKNKSFDVVFMDMEMPLMNGYQATRIIRALEAESSLPLTPIIAQTAHALPKFKQECMLSGCTEFLAKPFSKSALLTMLDAIIELKEDAAKESAKENP